MKIADWNVSVERLFLFVLADKMPGWKCLKKGILAVTYFVDSFVIRFGWERGANVELILHRLCKKLAFWASLKIAQIHLGY